MNKEILKDISYGMYIVCAKDNQNVGCTINTLTQITSEKPLVSISLNKENYTNQIIKKTQKFSVSILSEETSPNTIATFGFQSSKNIDKFSSIPYDETDNIPVIKDKICGYIICELVNVIDAETHDIFIGRIIETSKEENLKPMTYNYYHEVIKGKAPKLAPTYIAEQPETKQLEEKEVWVCDVCGYVHDGPISEDFICPICGMPYKYFKKINKTSIE